MKGFFRSGSPVIELKIESRKVEALLDTGFNGHILLPNPIIQELGLDQIGISDYVTASGDNSFTKVYAGKILLLEEEIEVPVLSTKADFALAGMELFDNCRIIIERRKDNVEVIKSR